MEKFSTNGRLLLVSTFGQRGKVKPQVSIKTNLNVRTGTYYTPPPHLTLLLAKFIGMHNKYPINATQQANDLCA